MSAGELAVTSGATTLLDGGFDFNVADLKPAIAYTVDGATGTLTVSQGSTSGDYENRWRLSLNDATPLDLHIALGAGDAKLELGRLSLDSLAVRLGAGDVEVDLRGTPTKSYSAKIQAGAGDTTIRLPADVGISARTVGLIGDVSVSGLEQRDGRWVNTRATTYPVTVDVEVQRAIGDLKIIAE
jgi:hypothetical protein